MARECDLRYEARLWDRGVFPVAGVDEAGRGPLAGPVVAAAVIVKRGFTCEGLDDSKKLGVRARERICAELVARRDVRWAVGVAEADEIDRLNILAATREAMIRAVRGLGRKVAHVLIDGLPVRDFPVEQTAVVRGDAKSSSIAAASVIAKVERDRIMAALDERYPEYGFARNKGYATQFHLEALRKHGPCPIHRRSCLPVRQMVLDLA